MLGVRGAYHAVRTANGPAQHLACAIVGLTYAGMFHTMVPDWVLIGWAAMSVMVMVAVVWLPKVMLKYALLGDFTFSALVLTFYFMHEPEPQGFVYYSAANMRHGHAPGMTQMSFVDMMCHAGAVVMMAFWSLYLSNLVQRQLLEKARFDARS
jgi:hypothetical protein